MVDTRIKIGELVYELDIEQELRNLTGHETMMIEDYLGGWSKFRAPENRTRSVVVMVWLAKKSAGESTTLDEIADMPGLVFGDAVKELKDNKDGQSPPGERSASTGGDETDAASTPPRSGGSGRPSTRSSSPA